MEKPRLVVVGSKALLFDVEKGNELFRKYFGKPFAVPKPKPDMRYEGPFVLSLYEALYLCRKGVVEIVLEGRTASCSDLEEYASRLIEGFAERYKVFEDLRERGYIVRSGMKFGTDFTVYEIGPGYEHAPYLVAVVREDEKFDPISIVRMGRVSHSVRKKLVLAIVGRDSKPTYLVFSWVKI